MVAHARSVKAQDARDEMPRTRSLVQRVDNTRHSTPSPWINSDPEPGGKGALQRAPSNASTRSFERWDSPGPRGGADVVSSPLSMASALSTRNVVGPIPIAPSASSPLAGPEIHAMESSELRASLPDLNTAGLGAALADLNTAVFGDNAVSADEHEMMEDLKMVETMSRGTTESQGVLFRSSSESVNVLRGSIARRLSREVSMSVVKLPDIDHFSNIVPKRVERENGGNGFAVSQKGVPAVPADTERQQAARHEAKELTMRQESTERLKEPDSVKPRMSDILCKIVRRHTDRRDDEWDYKDNHPMSLLNLEMTLPKMPIIFRAQEPLRAAQSHQPQSIPLPGVGGTDVLRRQIWCTLQGGTRLIPPSAGGQQHGPVARTRDLFTKERIWSIKIPAKDVPGVDGKEGIGSRRQYDDSAREANVGATIASVRGLTTVTGVATGTLGGGAPGTAMEVAPWVATGRAALTPPSTTATGMTAPGGSSTVTGKTSMSATKSLMTALKPTVGGAAVIDIRSRRKPRRRSSRSAGVGSRATARLRTFSAIKLVQGPRPIIVKSVPQEPVPVRPQPPIPRHVGRTVEALMQEMNSVLNNISFVPPSAEVMGRIMYGFQNHPETARGPPSAQENVDVVDGGSMDGVGDRHSKLRRKLRRHARVIRFKVDKIRRVMRRREARQEELKERAREDYDLYHLRKEDYCDAFPLPEVGIRLKRLPRHHKLDQTDASNVISYTSDGWADIHEIRTPDRSSIIKVHRNLNHLRLKRASSAGATSASNAAGATGLQAVAQSRHPSLIPSLSAAPPKPRRLRNPINLTPPCLESPPPPPVVISTAGALAIELAARPHTTPSSDPPSAALPAITRPRPDPHFRLEGEPAPMHRHGGGPAPIWHAKVWPQQGKRRVVRPLAAAVNSQEQTAWEHTGYCNEGRPLAWHARRAAAAVADGAAAPAFRQSLAKVPRRLTNVVPAVAAAVSEVEAPQTSRPVDALRTSRTRREDAMFGAVTEQDVGDPMVTVPGWLRSRRMTLPSTDEDRKVLKSRRMTVSSYDADREVHKGCVVESRKAKQISRLSISFLEAEFQSSNQSIKFV